MKVYDAFKLMIEEEKTIRRIPTGDVYKSPIVEEIGRLILTKEGSTWKTSSFFIHDSNIDDEWEVLD